MDQPPSDDEISEFKRSVTQRRVDYLRFIRDKGFSIDETALARLEADLSATETDA